MNQKRGRGRPRKTDVGTSTNLETIEASSASIDTSRDADRLYEEMLRDTADRSVLNYTQNLGYPAGFNPDDRFVYRWSVADNGLDQGSNKAETRQNNGWRRAVDQNGSHYTRKLKSSTFVFMLKVKEYYDQDQALKLKNNRARLYEAQKVKGGEGLSAGRENALQPETINTFDPFATN